MGGIGSGNRGANRGMEYWTVRKEREYEFWIQEQARLKEERRLARQTAAKERARVKARERYARLQAARKAAGIPCRHGGKEKPGASTSRVRRWRQRQRVLLAACDAAIRENKRRDRRIARGLPAVPKTHAERQADYLKRKAAERVAYLTSQWWAPALSEADAKAALRAQHPTLTEIEIHTAYAHLLACADHACLNINAFVLADATTDGIALAVERRTISYECYQAAVGGTSLPDILTVLKQAEGIASITDVPKIAEHKENPSWQRNVIQNSEHFAKAFWGRGERILRAVREAKK